MLKQFKEKFNREQEIYLRIKVNPGASQTVVSDILADETIKLDIAAAPEKNKANNELIKFLANNVKKFHSFFSNTLYQFIGRYFLVYDDDIYCGYINKFYCY